jgi:hypothetical protein
MRVMTTVSTDSLLQGTILRAWDFDRLDAVVPFASVRCITGSPPFAEQPTAKRSFANLGPDLLGGGADERQTHHGVGKRGVSTRPARAAFTA